MNMSDPCALEIANAVAALILQNQSAAAATSTTTGLAVQAVQLLTTLLVGALLALLNRFHFNGINDVISSGAIVAASAPTPFPSSNSGSSSSGSSNSAAAASPAAAAGMQSPRTQSGLFSS